MQVKNITLEQMEYAAACVGVTLDVTTLNAAGTRHRVKVNPADYKDTDENRPYQRLSAGMNNSRRVYAVCWHGFRDFFRACFGQNPDAVFRTSLDTWNGSADFESRYRESGFRNIGSQMYPTRFCDACACPDAGIPE